MDGKTIIPLNDNILRRAIYKVHCGECFYTGRKVKYAEMEIDHILPASKGGADCIENYVLTTKSINIRKYNSVVDSMVDRMLYINKCCYVDRVVNEYLRIRPYDGEYVKLRDYLKLKYKTNCPRIPPSLHDHIRRNVTFKAVLTEGKKRPTFVYEISSLDKFFSSRTCDSCGTVNKELKLSDRVWTCICGATHDRDVLAARNIKQFALTNDNLKYSSSGRGSELLDVRCCNAGG